MWFSSALETKNDKFNLTEQLSSSAVESGICTLKISPDGKLMASEDRGRNLSGVHTVTGGSDKSIRVKFTSDCEHIISTSADVCIFAWKILDELISKMRQKWLDRSGVSGLLKKISTIMRDYSSSQMSTPSPIQPRVEVQEDLKMIKRDFVQLRDQLYREQIQELDKEIAEIKQRLLTQKSLMVDLQQLSNDDQELDFSVRRATNKLHVAITKSMSLTSSLSNINDASGLVDFAATTSLLPSNTTGYLDYQYPNTFKFSSWAKKAFKEKEKEKRLKDNASNSNNTHIPTVTFSAQS
ncbi:6370_t:CDS:2 [Dentiscutata erythropus]|uniref:6370_t:CDS:1 n=1 Tax=Dentiscutata erythropus TaxID=1348616 RepID=A0A9N9NRI2_9GLOM|nr:6370_t:CDS:2 [Dentiscutata erythropus]